MNTICKLSIAFFVISTSSLVVAQDDPSTAVSSRRTVNHAKEGNVATDDPELSENEKKAIKFDEKTTEPIFLFDQGGGSGLKYGSNRSPLIRIYADGRVLTGGTSAIVESLEKKLTPDELTAFLHFVVNQNKALTLEERKILEKEKQSKNIANTRNGIHTKFKLNLSAGKHEFSLYAFDSYESRFPEWPEVTQIQNIRKRCMDLSASIHLGDEGNAILKMVNAQLKQDAPEMAPFTLDEIVTAQRLKNGRFQVRFSRQAGQTAAEMLHAMYFVSAEGAQPKVMLIGLPKVELPNKNLDEEKSAVQSEAGEDK